MNPHSRGTSPSFGRLRTYRRARGRTSCALRILLDGVQPTFGEKKPTDPPRDAMNAPWVEYRILRARSRASEGSGSQAEGYQQPSGPLPNGYPQPTDAVAFCRGWEMLSIP